MSGNLARQITALQAQSRSQQAYLGLRPCCHDEPQQSTKQSPFSVKAQHRVVPAVVV